MTKIVDQRIAKRRGRVPYPRALPAGQHETGVAQSRSNSRFNAVFVTPSRIPATHFSVNPLSPLLKVTIFGLWSTGLLPLSAADLQITKPGTFRLDENITIKVAATANREGLIRNELTISSKGPKGKLRLDRCALAYGEGTWALFAQSGDRDKTQRPGGARVTIVDQWAVQTYAFHPDASYGRFSSSGFDFRSRMTISAERFRKGQRAQFSEEKVNAWAEKILPGIKKEPEASTKPELELRLVTHGKEDVALHRPTFTRRKVNYRRLGKFVKLGDVLLTNEQLAVTGHSAVSIYRAHYGVTEGHQEKFKKLCAVHGGRTAALIKDGQVIAQFVLNAELIPGSFVATPYS